MCYFFTGKRFDFSEVHIAKVPSNDLWYIHIHTHHRRKEGALEARAPTKFYARGQCPHKNVTPEGWNNADIWAKLTDERVLKKCFCQSREIYFQMVHNPIGRYV